jgi:hypothetical protein
MFLSRFLPASYRKKLFSKNSSKGQSLVEFVLIIPIFFLLTVGAMQLIAVTNARSLVNMATYIACRDYATHKSSGTAKALAVAALYPLLEFSFDSSIPDPSIEGGDDFGDEFTVTMKFYYKLFDISIIKDLFLDSSSAAGYFGYYEIESKCTMIMEKDDD